MQAPADRAGDLGEAALDRHVDVLVVGRHGEAALAQLALDRVEPGEQRVTILAGDDPLRAASMRACARDCAMS